MFAGKAEDHGINQLTTLFTTFLHFLDIATLHCSALQVPISPCCWTSREREACRAPSR